MGRPKPKSIAELDAEMEDYFPSSNTAPAATNGAAQPAAAGGEDLGMDEISVCWHIYFSLVPALVWTQLANRWLR